METSQLLLKIQILLAIPVIKIHHLLISLHWNNTWNLLVKIITEANIMEVFFI